MHFVVIFQFCKMFNSEVETWFVNYPNHCSCSNSAYNFRMWIWIFMATWNLSVDMWFCCYTEYVYCLLTAEHLLSPQECRKLHIEVWAAFTYEYKYASAVEKHQMKQSTDIYKCEDRAWCPPGRLFALKKKSKIFKKAL